MAGTISESKNAETMITMLCRNIYQLAIWRGDGYRPPLRDPKKNSRVVDRRTGRSFPNKRFTDWHKAALLYLRTQGAEHGRPRPHRLHVHAPDQAVRLGQQGVSIMDLLVDAGVLPDDCWEVVPAYTVLNALLQGRGEGGNQHQPLAGRAGIVYIYGILCKLS